MGPCHYLVKIVDFMGVLSSTYWFIINLFIIFVGVNAAGLKSTTKYPKHGARLYCVAACGEMVLLIWITPPLVDLTDSDSHSSFEITREKHRHCYFLF
jgi:hypothetical protein